MASEEDDDLTIIMPEEIDTVTIPVRENRALLEPKITTEDLELLATPDEELKKRVKVFSFDDEQLVARISTGEMWQQLLQAHLYFDHAITLLLLDALLKPEAINASRMSFMQKLQLINALGLLPGELVATVEFINGLRNKIAHDLNFALGEKDKRDLANCTPKPLRDILLKDKDGNERDRGPIRFHELLRVILIQIDVIRQLAAYERLKTRKETIHLRTVLEKTEGAIYRE